MMNILHKWLTLTCLLPAVGYAADTLDPADAADLITDWNKRACLPTRCYLDAAQRDNVAAKQSS
jgi:hypothetical protein